MTAHKPRVGIYSGAFDPVHNGHIAFALEAARIAGLNKVYFLIEPHPRHKQGVKALEHRLNMVRLALNDFSTLGMIVLDQNRFNVHETWPQIEARFQGADIVMLLGDDVFWRLSRWPQIEKLVSSTEFAVGVRYRTTSELHDHMAIVEKTRHIAIKYIAFQTSFARLSSREVRHQLRQGHMPPGLDPMVVAYIQQNRLYAELRLE